MRNYTLWQAAGLVCAAVGILAVAAAFVAVEAGNDVRGALAVSGFLALIVGSVGALFARTRMRIDAVRRTGGDLAAATQGDPRWRGGALAALGVLLLAVLAAIAVATVPQLVHPGRTIEGTRFSGSARDAGGILLIYAGLVAFAAAAIVYGTWLMRTGRPSRAVMAGAAALLGLLLAYLGAR